MLIKEVTKENTLIYKGIGILLIILHNFFHWMLPGTGENEFDFSPDRVVRFIGETGKHPLEFINLFFSYLGHYGVQIFIFISGLGLSYSFMRKERSWLGFMLERLKKLYPLMIVGVIFYFFAVIVMHQKFMSVGEWRAILYKFLFIHTLQPGGGLSINGPWWFFGLIFQLYILFPLLFKLIKKYNIKAFLFICLICYSWIYISQYWYHPEADIYLLQNSPGHLPEFCFGILIALNHGKKLNPIWIVASLAIFVLGNFYKLFFPFTFLTISVITYWLMSKASSGLLRKDNLLKRGLIFFGGASMIIFAIHGYFRSPFIAVSGSIFWQRLIGAILFVITVAALSLIGKMFYQWLIGKIDFLSSKISEKRLSKKTKKI